MTKLELSANLRPTLFIGLGGTGMEVLYLLDNALDENIGLV